MTFEKIIAVIHYSNYYINIFVVAYEFEQKVCSGS